jgi:hypothetical protein
MKKCILLFVFGVSITNSDAQTMSAGLWSTNNAIGYTKITVSNNPDNKVYQIESAYTQDNDVLLYNIIVDGVTLPITLHEGSTVVVEGKNIAIKQVAPLKKMSRGTWKVLQQPEIAATNFQWFFVPRLNVDQLIASLKTEQEFLLSITSLSPNCTNTSMTVIIDGQPVKDDNNNVLILPEGSTISGKGKVISLRAVGVCTGNNTINGILNLKK